MITNGRTGLCNTIDRDLKEMLGEKDLPGRAEVQGDAGFCECYDVGGNDKFELMEQFAWFWINLAMFQGQGRDIGFKLLKR